MDLSQADDTTLLQLIEQHRADALGTLYDRYGRLVFSVAFRITNDPLTAEDICQDIFLRVWQKADMFRGERGTALTWLARMARNRAIDVLRRESARPEKHSVSWAHVGWDPVSQDLDLEEQAHLALEKHRVRSALAALTEEQRQTLALAYFQGLSHRQIASALDQPLGTVKSRLRSAMQRLREVL